MSDNKDGDITVGEVDRRLSTALDNLGCRIGSLDQAIRDMTERMITRVEYVADQKAISHRFDELDEDITGLRNRGFWIAGVLVTGVLTPLLVWWITKGG